MKKWPERFSRARELRKKQTEAELLLWRILRNRRFQDFKFRRQQPIGPYILDFFCPESRLAVELDGGGHADPRQKTYDLERTRFLQSSGIRMLRFWNNQIFQEKEAVLRVIDDSLSGFSLYTPHP